MLYVAVYPLAKSVYFFRFHNQSNQFIDHKGMKQIQISKTFDTFRQIPLVFAKQPKEKAPIAIYLIYITITHLRIILYYTKPLSESVV